MAEVVKPIMLDETGEEIRDAILALSENLNGITGPKGDRGEKGDPGQVDYEKVAEQIDKALAAYNPFAGGTVILPETEYTTLDEFGMGDIFCSIPAVPHDFVVGETYTVTFDGVPYECEYKLSDIVYGCGYLGNLSLTNSDEPFLILMEFNDGTEGMELRTPEEGTYRVGIYQGNTKLIDETCIPDSIARTAYVDEQLDALGAIVLEKADTDHSHDDRYYTEAETDTLISTHKHSWDEITGNPFVDEENVILPETEYVTKEDMSDCTAAMTDVSFSQFVDGEVYTIVFDGVSYREMCEESPDGSGRLFLGNFGINFEEPNAFGTGEPFWIDIDSEHNSFPILRTLEEKTYKVSIYRADYTPVTTETWTFELEDGSTVTKQVIVK